MLLRRLFALVPLMTATVIGPAQAQQVEQQRIAAAQQALARTGYATPVVIGHGTGNFERFWALTATKADSGMLVVVHEPGGDRGAGGSWAGTVLERAKTPAELGITGITFGSFLESESLFTVEVAHHPFMLETTHVFSTIHVVRDDARTLIDLCDLDGDALWSTSKGLVSNTTRQTVTIRNVMKGPPISFDLTRKETTSLNNSSDIPPTVKTETMRYSLVGAGQCRPLRPK